MPASRPTYALDLDEAEANLVLQGLGELPAKLGYNLITRVAQVIATTNQAWQTANPQTSNGPDVGIPGTPPAALMPDLVGDRNVQ